jgi:hypothetical protein
VLVWQADLTLVHGEALLDGLAVLVLGVLFQTKEEINVS